MKALRKKGFTSSTFSYNKEAWLRDNEERETLTASLKNKTNLLQQTALSNY